MKVWFACRQAVGTACLLSNGYDLLRFVVQWRSCMSFDTHSKFLLIQSELEKVRSEFLDLLYQISENAWNRRFPGEGWTAKQEMCHMAQAVGILPGGIHRALQGKQKSALAFIPTRIRSWVNGYILIPAISRKATRDSIAKKYEEGHQSLLSILETMSGEGWKKGTNYPRQYRTVEQIAYRPVEHFKEHASHLRRVLGMEL
jgi:hypothetical protein